MDASGFSGIAAIAFAFLFGLCACGFAVSAVSGFVKSDSIQRSAGAGGIRSRVLLSGFPPLARLSARILGFGRIDGYFEHICQRVSLGGGKCSKEAICSDVLFAMALLLFAGAVFGSLLAGIAFAACLVAGLSGWAVRGIERQREAVREALPDAVRAMGACFHAGFSLRQTFDQLKVELAGPIADLFGRASDAMETGSSAEEAIELIRSSQSVPELSFIAVALEVQHKSGGSMRHVLDAARESLEGELELRRFLKVQTAQARLSAQVVTGVTFALVGLLSLMTEDFLAPFFSSAAGMLMLAAALAMQCAGVMLIRRILKVEVS